MPLLLPIVLLFKTTSLTLLTACCCLVYNTALFARLLRFPAFPAYAFFLPLHILNLSRPPPVLLPPVLLPPTFGGQLCRLCHRRNDVDYVHAPPILFNHAPPLVQIARVHDPVGDLPGLDLGLVWEASGRLPVLPPWLTVVVEGLVLTWVPASFRGWRVSLVASVVVSWWPVHLAFLHVASRGG